MNTNAVVPCNESHHWDSYWWTNKKVALYIGVARRWDKELILIMSGTVWDFFLSYFTQWHMISNIIVKPLLGVDTWSPSNWIVNKGVQCMWWETKSPRCLLSSWHLHCWFSAEWVTWTTWETVRTRQGTMLWLGAGNSQEDVTSCTVGLGSRSSCGHASPRGRRREVELVTEAPLVQLSVASSGWGRGRSSHQDRLPSF